MEFNCRSYSPFALTPSFCIFLIQPKRQLHVYCAYCELSTAVCRGAPHLELSQGSSFTLEAIPAVMPNCGWEVGIFLFHDSVRPWIFMFPEGETQHFTVGKFRN